MSTVKNEVHQLIDGLPEDATWDDVAEAIELRRAVDEGMADLDAGRVLTHEEVKRRLLLA